MTETTIYVSDLVRACRALPNLEVVSAGGSYAVIRTTPDMCKRLADAGVWYSTEVQI